MSDRATVLALAERAEAGGDATLSDDVWRAMGWEPRLMGWYHKQSFSHIRGPRPNLAESIDAQEALPGRIVEVRHGDVSGHGDKVMWHARAMQDDDMGRRTTFAPTEPLARLAARLRAMAAAQEAPDGQ